MLEKYLNQLVQELELDSTFVTKNDEGSSQLKLNPSLMITFKQLDPGFYFYAPLAVYSTHQKEDFLSVLMQANFLGQGTGGGVISLDRDEKFLTMSLSLPYDMNFKAFKESLSDFANYVDYWKEEISNKINNKRS